MVCLRLFAGIIGFALKWPVDGVFKTAGIMGFVLKWPDDGVFQIVFEGIVGANYHGDIALDDLTLSTGSCTDTGSCLKLVQQLDTRLTHLCFWKRAPAKIWCKAISCKDYENTLVPTNLTFKNYEALWCGPVLTVNLVFCLFLFISFFIC